MKLTNISLAILVAIGLVACGGSDDNKNQPTDNNNAGHQGAGNGNPPPPPPPKEESGLDPKRAAPDLTVPKDLQTEVNIRKQAYLSRAFTDNALGYDSTGLAYTKAVGTKPGDIKLSSVYNYLDEGDTIGDQIGNYQKQAINGIYVGNDPSSGYVNNAFVKGKDGKYYRVQTLVDASGFKPDSEFYILPVVDSANVGKYLKDETEQRMKDSGFQVTPAIAAADYTGGAPTITGNPVDQSDVVFIANVETGKTDGSADVIELGKNKGFDVAGKHQVILDNVSVLGKTYNSSANGQSLDLSKLDVDNTKIQFTDVSGSYNIINGKGTPASNDDFVVPEKIEIGHIKAYNLPYSIAYVTLDPSKENVKDIFKIGDGGIDNKGGAYQVRGLKTLALPKEGRAFYTGKSFNATVEGEVKLDAEFFSDRAGVSGIVFNRKNIVTGKELPSLTLSYLKLTDPKEHYTYAKTDDTNLNQGSGYVLGDPKVDSWSVQFYGFEAQEAGGYLTGPGKYEEVYTTQRGRLTNLSNTSEVK